MDWDIVDIAVSKAPILCESGVVSTFLQVEVEAVVELIGVLRVLVLLIPLAEDPPVTDESALFNLLSVWAVDDMPVA